MLQDHCFLDRHDAKWAGDFHLKTRGIHGFFWALLVARYATSRLSVADILGNYFLPTNSVVICCYTIFIHIL